MQILHPFAGSVQEYVAQLGDIETPRPRSCPQCQANQPLTAHGFYTRTIVEANFDGEIPVRRYLCEVCRRTVSRLPEFALPYLRSSIAVIALWLLIRLLPTLAVKAEPLPMPYQRGQFWLRRFREQAESLCVALAALTAPSSAPGFVERALTMLASIGWIRAHRFLFAELRAHLLGWPRRWFPTAGGPHCAPPPHPPELAHRPFVWKSAAFGRMLEFDERQNRKNRTLPLMRFQLLRQWTDCPAGAGNAPARRVDAPRPTDRRAPLRHPSLYPPQCAFNSCATGFGGHAVGVDVALPPQRPPCATPQTA